MLERAQRGLAVKGAKMLATQVMVEEDILGIKSG
jgi:hypothetical protein